MKHYFKPTNLLQQFIISSEEKNCYIELNENDIEYMMEFTADEPVDTEDTMKGLKPTKNLYKINALRRDIKGVNFGVTNSGKRHYAGFFIQGFSASEEPRMYFKTRDEAEVMRDKLLTWFLNKQKPETGLRTE